MKLDFIKARRLVAYSRQCPSYHWYLPIVFVAVRSTIIVITIIATINNAINTINYIN